MWEGESVRPDHATILHTTTAVAYTKFTDTLTHAGVQTVLSSKVCQAPS